MNARLKSSCSLPAAAFVLFSSAAFAQTPASLDTPVKNFQLPRQLPECGLEAVLLHVARNAGVPIGLDRATTCRGHQAHGFPEAVKPLDLSDAEVVDGVPARDVLSRIAAMEPGYDWAIVHGVAVFRPSSAWRDDQDPLAARVAAMRFANAPAVNILGAILKLPVRAPEKGPHTTSVDFAGGTVLDGLNALVQSQPAMWYTSSNEDTLFVSVWFARTNDGFSVAAPLSKLELRSKN